MISFETRLREALLKVATEVPATGVPPLRLPADGKRFDRLDGEATRPSALQAPERPFSRHARWLAPVAAGATVLAIAVAAATIGGLNQTRPTPRPLRPADHGAVTSPGPSVVTHACRSGPRSHGPAAGVPAYYIAATGTVQPYPESHSIAGIYSTASGRLCAKLEMPAAQTVLQVSAAADDRTFVIAMSAFPRLDNPAVRFYLLRFDPARGISYRALAMPQVPHHATFGAVALSPAGDKLAIAFEPVGGNGGTSENLSETFRVLNIATGAVRTWSAPSGAVEADTANPWPLSWAADDRTLAVNWLGTSATSQELLATSGVRLLDTTRPGHLLVPDSRIAVPIHTDGSSRAISAGDLSDIAIITPDGATVVAAVYAFSGPDAGFAELSARTGHLERRLDWRPLGSGSTPAPMTVLWTSANGHTLIVYAPPGHSGRIGILNGNALTVLSADQAALLPTAAW